jgi:1-acyl-sn-glycerol-3-phosphate acyltransferase
LICGVFGSIIDAHAVRQISGREQLRQLDGPAIFVANHCSHVDTPTLLRSLPARWRRRTAVAAAADYFYSTRLLAGAVSLAFCTVPLERRPGSAGPDSIALIEQLIAQRWSLIVFAEGTRSRDARVGPMRSGAAVLAARHDLPIVPIHIDGTGQAMPLGRAWMTRPAACGRCARHTIRVRFGAPIRVGPGENRLEVMERVRMFMDACGAGTTPDPKLAARRAAAAAERAARAAQRVS